MDDAPLAPAGDLPELKTRERVVECGVHAGPLRVIEGVEQVRSNLSVEMFADRYIFSESEQGTVKETATLLEMALKDYIIL